jgi:uncharacterized protein (DUF58 family)
MLGALALGVGLLMRQEPTALAGLSLLVWVAGEGLWFNCRLLAAGKDFVRIRRTCDGNARQEVPVTVDRDVSVELLVRISAKLEGYPCRIEELMPAGCASRGRQSVWAVGQGRESVRIQYRLHPCVLRRIRLPGLRITLGDRFGLFREHRRFSAEQVLAVFPAAAQPQATVSVRKPRNSQALVGIHRHRHAGTSTELRGRLPAVDRVEGNRSHGSTDDL